MFKSSGQIYFLPTLLTNHRGGFSPQLRSTAKCRAILSDDWSTRFGENRLDQRSQTFGVYAISHGISCIDPRKRISHFSFFNCLYSIVTSVVSLITLLEDIKLTTFGIGFLSDLLCPLVIAYLV